MDILKKPRYYIIGTLVFFAISAVLFCWQLWSSFNISSPIEHEIWGQFGDFIGGTLGVIFSLVGVVFVLLTFHSQQKTALEQRFNDMFFSTLHFYQEQEKELQYRCVEKIGDDIFRGTANYKDFFNQVSKDLFGKFTPVMSFSKNRKEAVRLYAELCIPFGGKLSLCYRTLYRLLDMIDTMPVSNEVKRDYAKLLRAQFTENELLCIRYHIKYGNYIKFANLINKYHIMKHLPVFDMLEFCYWRNNESLTDYERNGVSIFLVQLCKEIMKQKKHSITECRGKLVFNIDYSPTEITLVCSKSPIPDNCQDVAMGLYKFNDTDLENLFECVMKELVIFSNFSCYNDFHNLLFESETQTNQDITTIKCTVRNRKQEKIILLYEDSKKSTIKKLF